MKHRHLLFLLAFAQTQILTAEESLRENQPIQAGSLFPESELRVETQIIKKAFVREAPEIPGTPAPSGNIRISVRMAKDPGLPDPPPPAPQTRDGELSEEFKALLEKSRRTLRFAFVSATVYDHEKTFFRIHPNNGRSQEITGWSNIDFNHFCGAAGFDAITQDGETIHYDLLMGIGNENTEKSKAFLQRFPDYQAPVSPELPDLGIAGPSFVLTGTSKAPESLEIVETLHNYYRTEGTSLEKLYEERQRAYEARKAYLIAHPPKPKNIDVVFWKREQPLQKEIPVQNEEILTEGGAR